VCTCDGLTRAVLRATPLLAIFDREVGRGAARGGALMARRGTAAVLLADAAAPTGRQRSQPREGTLYHR
jgi:hypothetical protein